MLKRLMVLTFSIISIAALMWASPSLYSLLGDNSSAAEAYDSRRFIGFALKEDHVRASIDEILRESRRDQAKTEQQEMIGNYLRNLVAIYEERAIEDVAGEDRFPAPIEGKVAYLTFDDGPSPTITPQILKVLE